MGKFYSTPEDVCAHSGDSFVCSLEKRTLLVERNKKAKTNLKRSHTQTLSTDHSEYTVQV